MFRISGVILLSLCCVSPTQIQVGVSLSSSWGHSQSHGIALVRVLVCYDSHSGRVLSQVYKRRYVNLSRLKSLQSERQKNYWLRRKKKRSVWRQMDLCWIDVFTRHFLNAWWYYSLMMYTECVLVLLLIFRIVCVPLVFSATIVLACIRIMAPNGWERLRCCGEMLVLVCMWQGHDTKIIASLSWMAWCLGFYCGSLNFCRALTWFVVTMSQRDLRWMKVLLLTALIYNFPVFGKRGNEELCKVRMQKKCKSEVPNQRMGAPQNVLEATNNVTYERKKSLQHSLELARCMRRDLPAAKNVTAEEVDLSLEFPFVPYVLLDAFSNYYGAACLRSILQSEWAPTLELWNEFRNENEAFSVSGSEAELVISEYLYRFATIHAEQFVQDKTDTERRRELVAQNKWIGSVRLNGDCLIAALLEELVYEASLLPMYVLTNQATYDALCDACRQALVALPSADVRKPRERDVVTGAVRPDVDESVHNNAYLQVDVHAEFILNFFLDRYNVPFPNQGLRVTEFSRFDHVLGAPASQVYGNNDSESLADDALDVWIYNSTGAGICGYHYEPVFMKRALPPPPAVPEGHVRKRKQTATEMNSDLVPMSSKVEIAENVSDAFYRIRVLSSDTRSAHGDPRESLQNALKFVASFIREDPTVPANYIDANVADENALREDVAVELPAKHCSFIGCAFCCDSDAALQSHLQASECFSGV